MFENEDRFSVGLGNREDESVEFFVGGRKVGRKVESEDAIFVNLGILG